MEKKKRTRKTRNVGDSEPGTHYPDIIFKKESLADLKSKKCDQDLGLTQFELSWLATKVLGKPGLPDPETAVDMVLQIWREAGKKLHIIHEQTAAAKDSREKFNEIDSFRRPLLKQLRDKNILPAFHIKWNFTQLAERLLPGNKACVKELLLLLNLENNYDVDSPLDTMYLENHTISFLKKRMAFNEDKISEHFSRIRTPGYEGKKPTAITWEDISPLLVNNFQSRYEAL